MIVGGKYMYVSNNVYLECWFSMNMLEKGWISLTILHVYWSLYIPGLRSSWGTSWACPAWSLFGHILTPALSLVQGIHARSHAPPEEVVYSLNDSCSHFTHRLSLQLSLASIYWTSYYNTRQCTHTYYTSQSYKFVLHHIIYTTHSCPSSHLHSSVLHGRLAVLGFVSPIRSNV
jgi:hypothetical protein